MGPVPKLTAYEKTDCFIPIRLLWRKKGSPPNVKKIQTFKSLILCDFRPSIPNNKEDDSNKD